MNTSSQIYEPAEDSELLLKALTLYLDKHSSSFPLKICEIGIGSAFVLFSLAKLFPQHNYYGSDISQFAIDEAKKLAMQSQLLVDLKKCSYLDSFKQEFFDLIFFNAPYLPLEDEEEFEELELSARALYGGKNGNEIIFECIETLYPHLVEGAVFFLLFSSLSKKNEIDFFLEKKALSKTLVLESSHFFETLYCYKIEAMAFLKQSKQHHLREITYLARGKHSLVYKAKYKKNWAVIKFGKEQHLHKEAYFLEKLQGYSFVPQLYCKNNSFLVLEYCDAPTIAEFLLSSSSSETLEVLASFFSICTLLDTLGITKFELTNPYKHVFVKSPQDLLFIDFERSLYSESPKNRRQALQYLRRLKRVLEEKSLFLDEEKVLALALEIKKSPKTELKDFSFSSLFTF